METARHELTADCIRRKPLDAMIERARNSPCPLYPQKRTSELVTFGAISSGSFATFAAIRRAYYRLIIWKMGIQKLQTKNYRGNPVQFIMILLSGKCSPRTQTKIMAFCSLFV
jgi:hypothetical protein